MNHYAVVDTCGDSDRCSAKVAWRGLALKFKGTL